MANSLPPDNQNRLVVDIGGGSTEFIVGYRLKPKQLESLYMGCVSFSERYFPGGKIDKKSFKDAQFAAARELESIATPFKKEGWHRAYGSSGTAKALGAIIVENGLSKHAITREGLAWLREKALRAGDFKNLDIAGVKGDRLPVLPGGLAIMTAIFEELDLHEMSIADTALRDGVLYDLLGRSVHDDVRDATVAQLAKRYHVDYTQARRVEPLAMRFFDALHADDTALALNEAEREQLFQSRQTLGWACRLHEIGISIAQAAFHKHSSYIIGNADMPGFSKREQASLAALILSQRGKLGKLSAEFFADREFCARSLCLRLAVLLSRSRRNIDPKVFTLARLDATTTAKEGFTLDVEPTWLASHDLTDYELKQEAAEWANAGVPVMMTGTHPNVA